MHARIERSAARSHGWRRGFTLIELLMVIVLIAILVGILLPVLAKTRKKAKEQQTKTTAKALMLAMRNYHFEHRQWPVPDPDPPDETFASNNYEILSFLTNATPRLFEIADHRLDAQGNLLDSWGVAYNVKVDKNYDGKYLATTEALPDGVKVISPGADGVLGTGDDIF